jgi:hypothetical protein
VPILGIEHDDDVSGDDDARFPEHEHPSDFELWLESDGVVRIRSGIKIIELEPTDARDLGLALIELADTGDGD